MERTFSQPPACLQILDSKSEAVRVVFSFSNSSSYLVLLGMTITSVYDFFQPGSRVLILEAGNNSVAEKLRGKALDVTGCTGRVDLVAGQSPAGKFFLSSLIRKRSFPLLSQILRNSPSLPLILSSHPAPSMHNCTLQFARV